MHYLTFKTCGPNFVHFAQIHAFTPLPTLYKQLTSNCIHKIDLYRLSIVCYNNYITLSACTALIWQIIGKYNTNCIFISLE